MKCIVLDDEELSRLILKKQISKFRELTLLEEFSNAMSAIKFLNHNSVDLIFLDIHMPDFSGFDFIQTLKNPPKVILVTSDRELAIEAFEYECVIDYIVKPIQQERLSKAIQKVKNLVQIKVESNPIPIEKFSQEISETELFINIDRRLIKIEFNSINMVEAKGDYIHIKTEGKNYIVHSTFKKIEDKLPKEIFLKIHRSYIINLKKIIDIQDNTVLIGKDVIPLSRSNRPELMNRLNLL